MTAASARGTNPLVRSARGRFDLLLFFDLLDAPMTHLESANPEKNILGDVGSVVSDSFKRPRSENKLEIRRGVRGILGHACEQSVKNLVAVLIHDIVAFQDLRS